jgi:hypothetical protein
MSRPMKSKALSIDRASGLKNPILGTLVIKGITPLDDKQGSDPLKSRCEESHQRLHSTESVTAVSPTIPLGYQTAPNHIIAFHPHGDLWVETLFRSSYGTRMKHKNKRVTAEALQRNIQILNPQLLVDSSQQGASRTSIPPQRADSTSQPEELRRQLVSEAHQL